MMNERDKDIVDIRKERDDCAGLLRRFIYATRPSSVQQYATPKAVEKLREQASGYLKRKGPEGSPLR